MKLKNYFVKPFSSFYYCFRKDVSNKNKWKMAFRDPAYLFLWFINILFTVFTIYLLVKY